MKKVSAIIVQLIHIYGPLKGTINEFNKNEILIGRHSACDLIFPGKATTISRKHAMIRREGNRFKIIDTSTNGLFINGKRQKEAFLKDGDVLIFSQGGPKVSFLTKTDNNAQLPDDTMQNSFADNSSERENIVEPDIHVQSFTNGHSQQHMTELKHPVNQIADKQPQSFNNNIAHQDNIITPNEQAADKISPIAGEPLIENTNVPLIVQFGAMLLSFKVLPIIIGKNESCDFTLNHPLLEDKHLQIFFWNKFYHIKDLTGRNRVLINNIPINGFAKLNPEDKITLVEHGPNFQFIEGGRLAEIIEKPNLNRKEEQDENQENLETEKQIGKPIKKGSFLKGLFNKTR